MNGFYKKSDDADDEFSIDDLDSDDLDSMGAGEKFSSFFINNMGSRNGVLGGGRLGGARKSGELQRRFSGGPQKIKENKIKYSPEVVSLMEVFSFVYAIVSDMGVGDESMDVFKNRYLIQRKITERLARKFNIVTSDEKSSKNVSKISVFVSKLMSANKEKIIEKDKEKDVISFFEDMADEILDTRKWWTTQWSEDGDDIDVSNSLKIVALESLLKINSTLNRYPFFMNKDEISSRMMDYVILKSKEVAKSWQDDNFGIDSRVFLYIKIIPLITDIAIDVWITASRNKLETVRAIEPKKSEMSSFVESVLSDRGFDSKDIELVCQGILKSVDERVFATQENNKSIDQTILAKTKYTIVGNTINMFKNAMLESLQEFESELSINSSLDKSSVMLEICSEKMDDKISRGGIMPVIEWSGFENIFEQNLYRMLGAVKAISKG